MCKSHKKYYKFIPLFILLGIGVAFLAGWVVQLIWNATISEIFNTSEITYWQGIMILILSKILFGAKVSSHHHPKQHGIFTKIHTRENEQLEEKNSE